MENIKTKLNKCTTEERINGLANNLIVNLTIKCPEGTFDISKMLYQTPKSILSKEPSEYTDDDVKVLQRLEKTKKATKTIAKSLLPKDVLKEIKDIQYDVRKYYNEKILLPEMPIMTLEDFKELKELINVAEGKIKNIQDNIAKLWDENLEDFEKDLLKAYPDAPIENIKLIVKKAKGKKNNVLGHQGFGVKIMVYPNAEGIAPELKKVMAEQTAENMKTILDEGIKEAFENVSNVWILSQTNEDRNYLIHGKTKNRIPDFAKQFSRKMGIIGVKNYKAIKLIQNKLNLLATEEYMISEEKTVDLCGEITYDIIQIAFENDINIKIPNNLDTEILELKFDDVSEDNILLAA